MINPEQLLDDTHVDRKKKLTPEEQSRVNLRKRIAVRKKNLAMAEEKEKKAAEEAAERRREKKRRYLKWYMKKRRAKKRNDRIAEIRKKAKEESLLRKDRPQ